MNAAAKIVEFTVSYRYGEYRRFCLDHLRQVKGIEAGRLTRAFLSVVTAVSFTIKKRRMPVCAFRIDSDEIVRVTADGRLVTKWPQVVAIHRYSDGYLIEKKSGAMPIPYRCLEPAQKQALESLFRAREAELVIEGKACEA